MWYAKSIHRPRGERHLATPRRSRRSRCARSGSVADDARRERSAVGRRRTVDRLEGEPAVARHHGEVLREQGRPPDPVLAAGPQVRRAPRAAPEGCRSGRGRRRTTREPGHLALRRRGSGRRRSMTSLGVDLTGPRSEAPAEVTVERDLARDAGRRPHAEAPVARPLGRLDPTTSSEQPRCDRGAEHEQRATSHGASAPARPGATALLTGSEVWLIVRSCSARPPRRMCRPWGTRGRRRPSRTCRACGSC